MAAVRGRFFDWPSREEMRPISGADEVIQRASTEALYWRFHAGLRRSEL